MTDSDPLLLTGLALLVGCGCLLALSLCGGPSPPPGYGYDKTTRWWDGKKKNFFERLFG